MDGDRLQVLANVDAEGARELLKAIQTSLALLEDENDVEVAPVRAVAPQVSLMITQAQRAKLREMGHDDETISNMTPAEAHKTLGILD